MGTPARRPRWQSGCTKNMTKVRCREDFETQLKEKNQSVVTRKDGAEETIMFGVWDLKNRGRVTGLEPR